MCRQRPRQRRTQSRQPAAARPSLHGRPACLCRPLETVPAGCPAPAHQGRPSSVLGIQPGHAILATGARGRPSSLLATLHAPPSRLARPAGAGYPARCPPCPPGIRGPRCCFAPAPCPGSQDSAAASPLRRPGPLPRPRALAPGARLARAPPLAHTPHTHVSSGSTAWRAPSLAARPRPRESRPPAYARAPLAPPGATRAFAVRVVRPPHTPRTHPTHLAHTHHEHTIPRRGLRPKGLKERPPRAWWASQRRQAATRPGRLPGT